VIPQWVIVVKGSSMSEKSLDLDKACLVNLVLKILNSLGILIFKTRRQLGKFESQIKCGNTFKFTKLPSCFENQNSYLLIHLECRDVHIFFTKYT